jgi:hypothetical protein
MGSLIDRERIRSVLAADLVAVNHHTVPQRAVTHPTSVVPPEVGTRRS